MRTDQLCYYSLYEKQALNEGWKNCVKSVRAMCGRGGGSIPY